MREQRDKTKKRQKETIQEKDIQKKGKYWPGYRMLLPAMFFLLVMAGLVMEVRSGIGKRINVLADETHVQETEEEEHLLDGEGETSAEKDTVQRTNEVGAEKDGVQDIDETVTEKDGIQDIDETGIEEDAVRHIGETVTEKDGIQDIDEADAEKDMIQYMDEAEEHERTPESKFDSAEGTKEEAVSELSAEDTSGQKQEPLPESGAGQENISGQEQNPLSGTTSGQEPLSEGPAESKEETAAEPDGGNTGIDEMPPVDETVPEETVPSETIEPPEAIAPEQTEDCWTESEQRDTETFLTEQTENESPEEFPEAVPSETEQRQSQMTEPEWLETELTESGESELNVSEDESWEKELQESEEIDIEQPESETPEAALTDMESETPEEALTDVESEALEEDLTDMESETSEAALTDMESENPEEDLTDMESGKPLPDSSESDRQETDIIESEFPETELSEDRLPEADQQGSDLSETEPSEGRLPEADQQGSDLSETEPSEDRLPEADQQESDSPETEQIEEELPVPESLEDKTSQSSPEESEAPRVQTEIPQTEKQPDGPPVIRRGQQYEITGDSNAWYRDENDRLWVRKGTNVYVNPTGSGTYNKGDGISNIQEDGVLTFQLSQVDEKGETQETSELRQESYFVDGEVPAAEASVSGNYENGVVYAAQSAEVSLAVAPDGKSGLKAVAYCIQEVSRENQGEAGDGLGSAWVSTETDPGGQEWIPGENGLRFSIRKEGVYRVYMRTEDQVGNVAFSESGVICIDQTPPEIAVKGVKNQTANSGKVPVQVECSDDYYKKGSLKITIRGANNGREPAIRENRENLQSASVTFFDFPQAREYDDIYSLQVEAQDLAGNKTSRTVEFSVNRFGSVYDLSEGTKESLDNYYLTEPVDITFLETNIDYVGESEIFCRENGELKQLCRNRDYRVTMEGSRDSWKQYQYTIPADYFQQEGVYELLLASRDQAENESDTGIQEKQVTFALDWTPPGCLITGIEEEGVYSQERVTACFQPKDNGVIRTMKIYRNSQLQKELTNHTELEAGTKLELSSEEEWQTVQVYLSDMAGNEYWSREIPVFVGLGSPIPYEKKWESAEEKEEKKRSISFGEDALKRKTGEEQPETADSQGVTTEKGERQVQKDGVLRIVPGLSKSVRKQEGILLLVLGLILFAVTAAVCIRPVKKRKSQ